MTVTPIPHSLRYSFGQTYPNEGLQYTHVHTIATGTVVTLMVLSPDAEEPAEFTSFVKSFRLLHPLAGGSEGTPIASFSSAPGYFAVLLVSAGVAALVIKSRAAGAVLPLIIGVAIARYNSRAA
jgi:hypothetical protein